MSADEQSDRNDPKPGALGAGAEAAKGMRDTNPPDGESSRGGDRSGSEPLAHDREHKGSYGGEGGTPRTSSDQRKR